MLKKGDSLLHTPEIFKEQQTLSLSLWTQSGQWVSIEDPVENRTSTNCIQTDLLPQGSFIPKILFKYVCPGSLSNPPFICPPSRWWAGLNSCAAGIRVHPTSSRWEIGTKNSSLLDFQGVSKAPSWKSLWQCLTVGIWPTWLLQL